MPSSSPQLVFIGAGNMAQALAGGLLAKGWAPDHLGLTDINQQHLKRLSTQLGINHYSSNPQAVQQADIVVLAVKPQLLEPVCRELAGHLDQQPLIISIAAGVTTAKLQDWLNYDRLVRVMPNTPSLVEAGAAGLYATASVSEAQKQQANTIVESAGLGLWFDKEADLDAVTAVSGSGPAYFFLLMESMISAGEQLGLSRDAASQLVLQTAFGAAKLAQKSDDAPAELRRKVTSPGGTTAAAIEAFEQGGFAELVQQALTAARDRSIELAAD